MKIKANLPFSFPFKGLVFLGAGFLCPAAYRQLCMCLKMAQKPSGSSTVLGKPLTSRMGTTDTQRGPFLFPRGCLVPRQPALALSFSNHNRVCVFKLL